MRVLMWPTAAALTRSERWLRSRREPQLSTFSFLPRITKSLTLSMHAALAPHAAANGTLSRSATC
jgi:hypothetical protein